MTKNKEIWDIVAPGAAPMPNKPSQATNSPFWMIELPGTKRKIREINCHPTTPRRRRE
jgi:hypothetical protein